MSRKNMPNGSTNNVESRSGRRSAVDEDVMLIKIDKFRIMYYDFDGVKITIHDFFDTRQDPKKRKY
jgi:hypothetical protein